MSPRAAVRSPDPWLAVDDDWVLRRLSPICSRIELGALPDERYVSAWGLREDLRTCLQALKDNGIPVKLGSGTAAAAEYFTSNPVKSATSKEPLKA